eukprot:XP_001707122.1 Hypothetical protein GL50803_4247 [Giardia lamblia ATCC 50803]
MATGNSATMAVRRCEQDCLVVNVPDQFLIPTTNVNGKEANTTV